MSKLIFISHKHDDHAIASVFNKHFQLWNVPQEQIFQSSDYRTSTVIGEPLKAQLKQALAEAKLVLLIYTAPDKDWEFCLWECGVATDPVDETPTRVALYQAGGQSSRVFQDDVVFKLDADDIAKFVTQFHKVKGFFKTGEAFNPSVTADILETRSKDLYDALLEHRVPGKTEERYRWDRFTLRVPADKAKEVKEFNRTASSDSSEKKAAHENAIQSLEDNAEVVDAFGQALLHFGYTASAKTLNLAKLIKRWRESIAGDSDTPQGWIRELCEEMNRSIQDRPAQPSWELMRSSLYPGWWFYPILNHARALADGSFEFDVYMYRLPGALPADIKVQPD
jgi:hypothetical protein